MGRNVRTADAIIGRIARARKGLATRKQLLGAGLSSREIQRRLERGQLVAEYPGVYRVGHAAPDHETS